MCVCVCVCSCALHRAVTAVTHGNCWPVVGSQHIISQCRLISEQHSCSAGLHCLISSWWPVDHCLAVMLAHSFHLLGQHGLHRYLHGQKPHIRPAWHHSQVLLILKLAKNVASGHASICEGRVGLRDEKSEQAWLLDSDQLIITTRSNNADLHCNCVAR